MKPITKINKSTLRIFIFVSLCITVAAFSFSCRKKSDQEQILDTLNGYFKAHASSDFKTSYIYLAPQIKAEISEEQWVTNQPRMINAVRLMRDPRLKNIVIKGDTATADVHYLGIPSETLTAVLSQIYTQNFHLPIEEIHSKAEEDMNNHFDELSAPQTRKLTFVRTPDGWRLLLDLQGGN